MPRRWEGDLLLALCVGLFLATVASGQVPIPTEQTRRPRKHDATAGLGVSSGTWAYVALLILTLFGLMLLSSKKLVWLGGHSVKSFMLRHVCIEALYGTMMGMDKHHIDEERNIEWGHQAFTLIGAAVIIANKIFNKNYDNRFAFALLCNIQLGFILLAVVFDCLMIRAGYLRSVRSVNTKLRWAHCVYQLILFCSDFVGSGLGLPIDCFIWATIHYSYEAVGLALEGLNVIGMSEMAIIVAVITQTFQSSQATTGWMCAFGLSSLALSSASIVLGMVWKLKDRESDAELLLGHHQPAPTESLAEKLTAE